ncbi:MAG: sulfoxide reductase heme-binding subunit YedZ [Chloroflexi bacterium AL-N1]|nr:sulfoxide reductase heme-binding subunit YedZ [Chloroflexi bacterium AL-N1]NOK92204.1 sulfoxide reductase heme-binding subunit YedZ [Chloroflexi bacterium AL-N15]
MARKTNTWLRIIVHIASILPLAVLIWDFTSGRLSVNPIEDITSRTGTYALVWLILSLVCTPINTLSGFKPVMKLRRPLGLYAFMYVCLHLLTFTGLDYGFNLNAIIQTIIEKRYILAGFSAFLLLLPLAITSTKWWQRRLGRFWRQLHRLVYVAALLGVLHYVWLVKSDIREPLLYGTAVVALLILRTPYIKNVIKKIRTPPRQENTHDPQISPN